jgi:serine/threonine protein kinase
MLGSGGMSTVYKARDLHFSNVTKLVAVKEVISSTSDPSIQKMVVSNFEREADILATLSHPAIPRIYDYFIEDNRAYLVMEFIKGRDLEEVIEEKDDFMPQSDVVGWAIELCAVLSYLHHQKPQPVIFRDVKPSNLMVDEHSHIRLIDFGIARLFQPGEKGTMIGTEGYSPPEQYRGEASPAGDIYALCATLHHLLTDRDPQGEPPFSFDQRAIREINEDVSPELERIINRGLAYDPKDRWQSADEMREELLEVARSTKFPNRPTQNMSTTDIGVLSNQVKELWSFECEDEVRGTPIIHDDVLYVGCYDNNIYALDADDGSFQWKYGTEGGIPTRPAIYQDLVLVGSEDHRLYALTADAGDLLWTYYAEGPIRSSPTLFENHLFFGCDDSYLHVVNLESGSSAWKTGAAGPIRTTPLIADERVYFGADSGDFYCTDFRGELKWRFKTKRSILSSPLLVDGLIYIGATDWTVYAIAAEAGWEIWRFRLGKATMSTPAYAEGNIFIGCADHHIYAIDARSSREVWRFETEHQVNGSPIIHEDSLYCGSVDGSMYCLDFRSGRKRWQFETDAPITGTPIVHKNVLYFGSNNHRVYALLT